jgi:hypothetical protein
MIKVLTIEDDLKIMKYIIMKGLNGYLQKLMKSINNTIQMILNLIIFGI